MTVRAAGHVGMSDLLALSEVIAAWIAVSLALWGMRRWWIRSRQRSRLDIASRAIELSRNAQTVFDTIRMPVPLENEPDDAKAYLRAETYALFERVQEQGAFFDRVNTLRVQLQAALGVEDHKGLSDILHLRRDLWAASEIVLVEDPSQFGRTFAEEGAFERFRAEAVRTLFKLPGDAEDHEDVIDLRLTLAVQEAETFAGGLADVIAAERERDRLPTPGELAAYPLAWLRVIPAILRGGAAFTLACFEQAALLSRRIRGSETVAQGTARMRQISEDWPQRLSDGFQRTSEAARGNVSALRQHYDFLVAAHDFKGKYQTLIQRAPELSERGRQFVARLELAERSERLRLTSANAAVWTARKTVDGLAYLIAFLRRVHEAMQETVIWSVAEAALAPAPVRGRRIPAFKSYHRALAASGLSEVRPVSGWKSEQDAAKPVKRKKKAPVKAAKARREDETLKKRGRGKPESVASAKAERKPAAAKTEKRAAAASTAKQKVRKGSASAKSSPRAMTPAVSSEKRRGILGMFRARPVPAKADGAVEKAGKEAPKVKRSKKQAPAAIVEAPAPPPAPVAVEKVDSSTANAAPPPKTSHQDLKLKPVSQPPAVQDEAKASPVQPVSEARAEPVPDKKVAKQADDQPTASNEAIASTNGRKSRSFLGRLFRRDAAPKPVISDNDKIEAEISFGPELTGGPDTSSASPNGSYEPPQSLMDKLSSLDTDDDAWIAETRDDVEETLPADADDEIADDQATEDQVTDDEDDFGPLTQNVMELQVKKKPAAPQIRAFPWLRQ